MFTALFIDFMLFGLAATARIAERQTGAPCVEQRTQIELLARRQVRLVHEGRRLERVATAFASELPARNNAELIVHERHHAIECAGVAVAPCEEELRYVARVLTCAHGTTPNVTAKDRV